MPAVSALVRYLLALYLVSCCTGCAGYYHDAAQSAANGAAAGLVANDPGLARLGSDIAGAARDQVFGPVAQAELDALANGLVRTASTLLAQRIHDIVQQELQVLLASLPDIRETLVGTPLRDDGAALREELFGAPMRADLDALIDAEVPRLTAALALQARPVEQNLDSEIAKWRPIAIGFAVGCASLLVGLALLLHRHNQIIEKVLRRA